MDDHVSLNSPTNDRPATAYVRRRWLSIVAAIALTIGGVLGVAAPADAATVVGVCTITVGEPHASSHVSGTINSYGRLSCSIGMTEIYIRAYLEKSTGSSWGGNTESWLNTPAGKTYSSYAKTSCSQGPGTFRTRLSVAFTSPPGYNPSYHANTYYSVWRGVACGVSFAPAFVDEKRDSTPASEVTFSFLDDGTVRVSEPTSVSTEAFTL